MPSPHSKRDKISLSTHLKWKASALSGTFASSLAIPTITQGRQSVFHKIKPYSLASFKLRTHESGPGCSAWAFQTSSIISSHRFPPPESSYPSRKYPSSPMFSVSSADVPLTPIKSADYTKWNLFPPRFPCQMLIQTSHSMAKDLKISWPLTLWGVAE